ncbi:MAG: hypothetical protein QOF25_2169 [Mycobacterium sp.]|nr:hypothetical protein [Mycobacterium sp.]
MDWTLLPVPWAVQTADRIPKQRYYDDEFYAVRMDSETVRAYDNACRHRGMKLVEGRGSRRSFVCPFHGWCWGLYGANTFVLRPEIFDEKNLCAEDLSLVPVKCELWGGSTRSGRTRSIRI